MLDRPFAAKVYEVPPGSWKILWQSRGGPYNRWLIPVDQVENYRHWWNLQLGNPGVFASPQWTTENGGLIEVSYLPAGKSISLSYNLADPHLAIIDNNPEFTKHFKLIEGFNNYPKFRRSVCGFFSSSQHALPNVRQPVNAWFDCTPHGARLARSGGHVHSSAGPRIDSVNRIGSSAIGSGQLGTNTFGKSIVGRND